MTLTRIRRIGGELVVPLEAELAVRAGLSEGMELEVVFDSIGLRLRPVTSSHEEEAARFLAQVERGMADAENRRMVDAATVYEKLGLALPEHVPGPRLRFTELAVSRLAALRLEPGELEDSAARLLTRTGLLEDFPRLGRRLPERVDDDLRELVEARVRLVYRVTPEAAVEVLTVFVGAAP